MDALRHRFYPTKDEASSTATDKTYIETAYETYVTFEKVNSVYMAVQSGNPGNLIVVTFQNAATPIAELSGMSRIVTLAHIIGEGIAAYINPVGYALRKGALFAGDYLFKWATAPLHPEIGGAAKVILKETTKRSV